MPETPPRQGNSEHRRAHRLIRDAGFPRPKRLEDFSFEAKQASYALWIERSAGPAQSNVVFDSFELSGTGV